VAISNQGNGDQLDERDSEDEHYEIEGEKRINEELVQQNNA
jgi:hypothetical protein